MPKIFSILIICSVFFLSACLENKDDISNEIQNSIIIHDPYAFATMPGGSTGAAFMKIENVSTNNDRLISAQSNIAEITEIHQNWIDPDDGMMMMRRIRELVIPAKGHEALDPKGYHIMFIKLKEPLTMGQSIPITLEFEQAGLKTIDVKILPPGMSPDMADKHAH